MAWRGGEIEAHDKTHDFQVARISVERRRTPFTYRTYEKTQPDNTSLVGEFGIYKKEGATKFRLRNFPIGYVDSFMVEEQSLVDCRPIEWKDTKEMSQDIKEAGSERCFFTGRDRDLVVVWIVPPILCEELKVEGQVSLDSEPLRQAMKHQNPLNTITIGKEFEDLFRNNEIMVDVDKDPNELHVLCFNASSLPTQSFNLQQPNTIASQTLFYLKLHSFRGVLRGTVGGGFGEERGMEMETIYDYLNHTPARNLTLKRIRRVHSKKIERESDVTHLEFIFQWLAERHEPGTVPAIREEGGPEEVSEPSGDESANDTDDGTDADTTEDEMDAETEDVEDDTDDNTDDCEAEADPEDEE
ncbi:hypothetical protein H0H92_003457 [Tricholoma furcatifolium]|nr:hypothetical protein H0H92_003457 [Tricholoma furcatifolium]